MTDTWQSDSSSDDAEVTLFIFCCTFLLLVVHCTSIFGGGRERKRRHVEGAKALLTEEVVLVARVGGQSLSLVTLAVPLKDFCEGVFQRLSPAQPKHDRLIKCRDEIRARPSLGLTALYRSNGSPAEMLADGLTRRYYDKNTRSLLNSSVW